jgi:hypothetical protein
MSLEGLTRREEAISVLETALTKTKTRNTSIALALAKLLFKGELDDGGNSIFSFS